MDKKYNFLLKENFSSENLFEKMSILEYSTLEAFNDGMTWTKDHNIDRIIVGGTAVVNFLKKGRDLTPDIDILVANLNDVKKKLDNDGIKYTPLIDNSGSGLGITVPKFNIDFLTSVNNNRTLTKAILANPGKINIGGNEENIISPELLAIAKLDLGRTKDLDDGFALLKSGLLSKEKYLKFANGLKSSLNDYESLVSYAYMLN